MRVVCQATQCLTYDSFPFCSQAAPRAGAVAAPGTPLDPGAPPERPLLRAHRLRRRLRPAAHPRRAAQAVPAGMLHAPHTAAAEIAETDDRGRRDGDSAGRPPPPRRGRGRGRGGAAGAAGDAVRGDRLGLRGGARAHVPGQQLHAAQGGGAEALPGGDGGAVGQQAARVGARGALPPPRRLRARLRRVPRRRARRGLRLAREP